MKVLAIDTSTLVSSVAVIEDNVVLGEISLSQEMTHSENLVPMIDEIFKNIRMDISEIDLYAVAVGPGSFTGLRIGLATAKGFAHLFDKPIVGVSTLEGLAYSLVGNEIIVPMIDARRERVYGTVYSGSDGLEVLYEEAIYNIDELIEILNQYDRVVLNGNGSLEFEEKLLEGLKDKLVLAPTNLRACRASSIGELGLKKYREGIKDDYFSLAPEYLRETQAQRELDKKGK